MIRTSGVVTLVLVLVSAVTIGAVLVRRAVEDLSGYRLDWDRIGWGIFDRNRVTEDLADCRGAIGIEVTGLSGQWRSRLALPDSVRGAVITGILPGSPALEAGLRVGDVVSAAGATRVTDACSSEFAFGRTCKPYELTVNRGPGQVTLWVTPESEAALFEEACNQGAQSACYRLAWLTWHGNGVPRDEGRAMQMYDEACRAGSGAACTEAGQLSSSSADRHAEALALLERACGLDDPQGCLLLASAFAMGTIAPRDDARATPIYEKACALGSALGCYNTGLMYNLGRGVPVDHVRAFRAYAEGCAMGSTTACTDEGVMRQHGRGVARDEGLAVALYQRGCAGTACQAGNLLGCLNLGKVYRDGLGVAADPARAAQIFREVCGRALDAGDVDPAESRARACSLLGSLYLVGQGVDTDPVQGLAFSTRGCDQGDGYGCFNAGVVFSRGLGVEPDEERAMGFFRRACAAGDEEACDHVLRRLPTAGGAEAGRGGNEPR
jgi:TPR repeat protein